jgi:integrase
MPIRKHPESSFWWFDVRTPSGERIRRSTGTKDRKAAQEYHDRLKAELWRTDKLGEQPNRIFEEAALAFLKASEGQTDYATKLRHTEYWLEIFAGRAVSSLTSEEIARNLPTHRVYKHRPTRVLSPATRNRHAATIKRMLSLCEQWGWITKAPKSTRLKEPKIRIRWLTQQQARAMLDRIRQEWVRDVCRFALATGMRANEILQLQWSDVDITRQTAWVTREQAKSGRARSIPLNRDALDVLAKVQRNGKLVFTRGNGRQVKQVDVRGIKRACKELGLENFRFHDFRHTWASWHVQAGTPLMVLKELGGWETLEMVQKYAHMSQTHLADHANAVTFWAQQTQENKTPPIEVALSA